MTTRLLLTTIIGTIFWTSCIYTKVPDSVKHKTIEDLKTEKGRSCIETNQEEFFGKMINQRLSKIEGNNWDIFFKDTVYIYYGHTLLTKKGLYVDRAFKVKRILIEEFPKFEEVKFHQIRSTILNYAYKDYSFGENYSVKEANDSFRLRGPIIFVDTKRKYKTWKANGLKKTEEQVYFKIAVDAKTLALLSIAQMGEE
jgi:hypothetical protein